MAPVRAGLDAPDTAGAVMAVVPHSDLIRMIRQEALLRLTFLASGAVLSGVNGEQMEPLPLVFLEGGGLKCYALNGACLPIYKAKSMSAAA